MDESASISELLTAWGQGDALALERLTPQVYDELHQIARAYLRREASAHSLPPTALINEAFVRMLNRPEPVSWANRAHFFAIASRLMRNILVDRARRKKRAKHGGEFQRLDIDVVEIAAEGDDEKVLLVHEALNKLAAEDPVKAEVVKLHYFAGLTHQETAQVLKLSEKTVRRHWNFARVWLYRSIRSQDGEASPAS